MSLLSWLRGEQRTIDASDFNIGDDLFTGLSDFLYCSELFGPRFWKVRSDLPEKVLTLASKR